MAWYWSISALYCLTWLAVTFAVWVTGWHHIRPNLSAWISVSAIQAVLTTAGGASPTAQWTLYVWLPLECLAVALLGLAAVEAMPAGRASSLLGSALAALPLAWLLTPDTGGWYSAFLQFREWVFLTAAISVGANVIILFAHPVSLPPAVYRANCIWAVALTAAAVVGPIITLTGNEWINARCVYRTVMTICCFRWAMLVPRMRLATARLVEV